MQFHDLFDGVACKPFPSDTRGDIVGCLKYFFNRIGRADTDTAGFHHRDVRNIVPEIHHFIGRESVTRAEIIEILYLVPGAEVDVFRSYSAGKEALADAFRTSSGNYRQMIAVHRCHTESETVLGIECPEQFAGRMGENAPVRQHSVDIEGECPDLIREGESGYGACVPE